MSLANDLIHLGAKYGNSCKTNNVVNTDGLFPSARSASRHTSSLALSERQKLIAMIAVEADHKALGVTTDLWTHKQTTLPYITVTLHFKDTNWNFHSRILATRSMEEKKISH